MLAGAQDVLWALDALFGADLADVDHAFDAFCDLHEGSELGEAGDGAFDYGAYGQLVGDLGPWIAEGLLEAEGDAALGEVDAEDDGVYGFAGLEEVAGLADFFGPGHLGEVNHAFDAGFELDEGSEVCGTRDGAADALACFVFVGDGVPWVRLELLQAEGDAALSSGSILRIFGFDLLADGEDVGGLGDAVPADVADVEEAVGTADVDEGAVVGEGADGAGDDVAFLELGVAAVLVGAVFFFERRRGGRRLRLRLSVSSLMMRQRISWPTSFSMSAASRAPLREPGMKARTPMSTVRPPLTTAVTVPAMVALSAKACSRADQSLGCATLMRERS